MRGYLSFARYHERTMDGPLQPLRLQEVMPCLCFY
jgi:hypothetical protein